VKINDSGSNPMNALALDKAAASEKAQGVKPDAVKTEVKKELFSAEAKSSDSVTLSPMAQQLKSIESNIGTDKVFDAQKVSQIKDAIASGQFKVDTAKVADGLIESVKTMLAK
jgi:negative regulator of flagellin synthesis FlgM